MTTSEGEMPSMGAARSAVATGSYEEAVRLVREVLEVEPDHREALDMLGFVLFFLGRSGEAEPFCRLAVLRYPDHAYAWKGLGMHLVRLGQRDEGFRAIRRATELRPDWFDPHWDFLVMARRAGDRVRFDAMMQTARSRFPAEHARLAALAADPWPAATP